MKRLVLLFTLAFVITSSPQTAVEAWARRYNSNVDSHDESYVVKTDSEDNVLVAGTTYKGAKGSTGGDLLLIKYSNSGVPVWTNRYDGPGHGEDLPVRLAVDGNNNIVVIVNSIGSEGYFGFATIKYSSAGMPLWTNHYHGSDASDNFVNGLAVDGSGNVYVTGTSIGLGTGEDCATIKYSSAGTPLWTNRYDGPANGHDSSYDLALDTNSNLFITGYSESGGSNNMMTISYSSGGVELWVNRYSGPWGGDAGNAVAVAGTNVYVCGTSLDSDGDSDFVTIAYSTAGVPLWTNRYNGTDDWDDYAFAIATAGTNVFVSGVSIGSGTGYDYATIAYSAAGVPLWTQRYDGPGSKQDSPYWPNGMTLDSGGNVCVTGHSVGSSDDKDYATIKYSSDGTVLWVKRYDGVANGFDYARSVATDGNGNVFVAGSSASAASTDLATIKYLSDGTEAWTNYYNGTTLGNSAAMAVVVDGSGNVIVTGGSGHDTESDYITVKYSSTGESLWTNRYDGNLTDFAYGVAVNESGDVYVTGTSFAYEGDYATIKYSNTGAPLWTNRYDGPSNGSDEVQAIAVDGNGSAVVTGYSQAGSFYDYATIKYSSAGTPLWTNRYDGPGGTADHAFALAVDTFGNVVVTGTSDSGPSYDCVTIKYSSTGVPWWTNRYDGSGGAYDEGRAVAVDPSGDVYVSGSSYSASSADDIVTIKYASSGELLWINRYDGPAHGGDEAQAVAVDVSGNVYVTGGSYSGSSYDYATIKYSSTGTPLWTNRYDGPAGGNDHAGAVAIDGNGTVFVNGTSIGLGGRNDYATVAYSSAGVALWTNRYDGPLHYDDISYTSRSLAVTGVGSVVVTGVSFAGDPDASASDFLTIKYLTVPVLSIQRTLTNTIAISWPSPSTGFQLQQNTNGIATLNWSNVPTAPIDDGTNKILIVDPAIGSRFYRLIYP